MNEIGEQALLIEPLELLSRVEDSLISDQSWVVKKSNEEVGKVVGQPLVRAGSEQGSAANVV